MDWREKAKDREKQMKEEFLRRIVERTPASHKRQIIEFFDALEKLPESERDKLVKEVGRQAEWRNKMMGGPDGKVNEALLKQALQEVRACEYTNVVMYTLNAGKIACNLNLNKATFMALSKELSLDLRKF